MAHRIEVAARHSDTRALVKQRKFESSGFKVKSLLLVDVYILDVSVGAKQLGGVAQRLHNPVTQFIAIDKPISSKKFDWAVETGFLPGVTDNVGSTVREGVEDLLKRKLKGGEGVYSSQLLLLAAPLSNEQVDRLALSLINPLIQRVHVKSYVDFIKDQGMGIIVPKVKLHQRPEVSAVSILEASDEELVSIGKHGILAPDGTRRGPLALDLTYMKTIQSYFKKQGRNPTDIELESIAQTWSEHCKHTIFADPMDEVKEGLFKVYIKAATNKIRKEKGKKDFCLSVFTDNSGGIAFDKDWIVTDKVETHNSPSALDPFGGAITGIVGVNRDAMGFGLGAKPIINRYGFCFADPNDTSLLYKGQNLTQPMLPPKRIMEGVIEGVNVGGNCSGIPTPQGFVFFDPRYKGKPLVFVGTAGLIPRKSKGRDTCEKQAQAGDHIVMVGGRVGLDGIHGATFSSEAMDAGSPATAVQIGDPITQKKMSDAIVKEARDLGLYSSITDNGAGGLSCSIAEMAKECGGCTVDLDKVPLKYPGLEPWQTWISESQERMTLSVPKNSWKAFSSLMQRRGVEATVVGEFTSSEKCVVKYHGKTVMDVDMKFLHDGLPPRPMKTTYTKTKHPEPKPFIGKDFTKLFLQLLGRLNMASYEFISMQYDHEVQAGSVIKPLQGRGRVNGDATITRPVLSSKRGVVLSQGINPTYSDIDTYHMAACAIDTAIRNAIAIGASLDCLALLDNFCWCSSTEPERLGQLKAAVKACYDYALAYGTPFISGKDSMFNDFKGFDAKGNPMKISVPPTLLVSTFGVVEDASKAVSLDAKFSGDLIYILGGTFEELGGSEFWAMQGFVGNSVPKVDAQKNKKLYMALSKAIQKGLVASCQSVHRGGLAVALAKTAMGGMLGLEISLKNLPGKVSQDEAALFSESQGRFVVTINPKHQASFEAAMKGNACTLIGKVAKNSIQIKGLKGNSIVKTTIDSALKAYKSTFKGFA
ncbi:MAG TPA: AIR synthase-related protein [Candidatus Nanoarchaeia archaeon]|nr:AIR synthase-related protein [Candidatus Nanoarchaeia archaeon]